MLHTREKKKKKTNIREKGERERSSYTYEEYVEEMNQRSDFKSWMRLCTFHFTLMTLGKGLNPSILPPAMGK